ncbi:hypothetical protein [Aureimonas sp. AU22]|uniref:hypothetical protein n=1 Tax=Aureimonas sp. AU22 TaxID=1638162 RepID=UPI000782455B|nr:hypothetical protein [Aureimonas sp. AU22]
MKTEKMPRLRKGSRMMGGPMGFLVSVDTQIDGSITLPPDRYRGTVAWKETATRSGVERSRKRYKIELPAADVVRWGGEPVTGGPTCLIDISAEVASGDIQTL